MFIHLLAGGLVFLCFGNALDIEITKMYLIAGAFWGIVADPISFAMSGEIKFDKWTYTHRDNFSHSIFFPMMMLVLACISGRVSAVAIGVAMLTHPLLDLWGIGWGVKLFYPLSQNAYKLFYQGRTLMVWSQKEIEIVAEGGHDDWIKTVYFTPNLIGASEWLSLAGFVALLMLY